MIIRYRDKELREKKMKKDYYDSYDVVGRIILMQGFAGVLILLLMAFMLGLIFNAIREGIN
jgi:hypothetical protein